MKKCPDCNKEMKWNPIGANYSNFNYGEEGFWRCECGKEIHDILQ